RMSRSAHRTESISCSTSGSQQYVDTYEGPLDGSKPVRVLSYAADLGFTRPVHARTGYLLFYRSGQILLMRFDPGRARVSGNAILVGSGVVDSAVFSERKYVHRTQASRDRFRAEPCHIPITPTFAWRL